MEIRELTKEEKQTLHLKNEPFLVYGRVVPSLKDGLWQAQRRRFIFQLIVQKFQCNERESRYCEGDMPVCLRKKRLRYDWSGKHKRAAI